MHETKYTHKDDKILKDGHTMFIEDVVRELNRKAFLEKHMKRICEDE